MSPDQSSQEAPPSRQDPAAVRDAARACLTEHASIFALALTAIAVRRSGATAEDWALVARALLDPDPEDRVEGAGALVDRCLQRAVTDAPGHPEIKRLRAEAAGRRDGIPAPREEPPAVDEILADLFDALASAPAQAFLEVPPDAQDVAVTELVDEAEPRTATLVAAILLSGVNPALQTFLLESLAPWAAHPDLRDAVEDLAASDRAALLEPALGEASRAVDAARPAELRHRPSEGRPARRRPPAASRAGEPGAEETGIVCSGTVYRRASVMPIAIVGGLAATALILAVVILGSVARFHDDVTLPFAACAGAAVVLGIVAFAWARAVRVRYRIVRAGVGARFEIDAGDRAKSLPFPLDYRAAYQSVIHYVGRHQHPQEIVTLRLAILDGSGNTAVAFEEALSELEDRPRGWVPDVIELPPSLTYGRVLGRIHVDRIEREIARWNQAVR
jgi:hypothetical protein